MTDAAHHQDIVPFPCADRHCTERGSEDSGSAAIQETTLEGLDFVASLLKRQEDVLEQLEDLGSQIDAVIEEIAGARKTLIVESDERGIAEPNAA